MKITKTTIKAKVVYNVGNYSSVSVERGFDIELDADLDEAGLTKAIEYSRALVSKEVLQDLEDTHNEVFGKNNK